VIKIERVL